MYVCLSLTLTNSKCFIDSRIFIYSKVLKSIHSIFISIIISNTLAVQQIILNEMRLPLNGKVIKKFDNCFFFFLNFHVHNIGANGKNQLQ